MNLPFYLVPVRPQVEIHVQCGTPQCKKDMDIMSWREARGGPRMVGGLEHLPCQERLREPGLFWGNLTAAFQYLKRAEKKDGERLLTRAGTDRTRVMV